VLPSDKPLEFQGRGGQAGVHSVPASPSITDRFGAYLVPTSEPDGRLFTVKDLAVRWGVCTATIYSLAKSGRLESLRIGNSIRFMAIAVTDYEQTRIGARAERHPDPNTH
jgi:excisionase family DNA binding protein